MATLPIETERLVLREWRAADIAPFQAICADPEVMRWLGPPRSLEETAEVVARMQMMQARDGCCFWAVERKADARLIGWCGIIRSTTGPIEGKAEAGWRLARDCWGQGYASEGARASIAWAFDHLPDAAVWAITAVDNKASRAVMERVGMRYCPELDFAHPRIAADDPLSAHVTYRIERPA